MQRGLKKGKSQGGPKLFFKKWLINEINMDEYELQMEYEGGMDYEDKYADDMDALNDFEDGN